MSGYQYCRIDGNTPHDTRQDLIEEYNAPVIILCHFTLVFVSHAIIGLLCCHSSR